MTSAFQPTTAARSDAVKKAVSGSIAIRSLVGALKTWRGRIGAALSLLVIGVALAGPLIPKHFSATQFAGAPFSAPGTNGTILGTDRLGRDVLARTLDGGWAIIVIGTVATALTVGVGAMIGVSAAYRRGLAENILMRGVDVVLAIPQLVFVLLLLSVIGPKPWLIVVSVGLAQVPQTARVMHGAAQNVCERDFVKAMSVIGMAPNTVLRRHVLPNLVTPLMVELGLRLSNSLILIAGLGFLGFSSQRPPAADWGLMISENRLGLGANVWGVIAPAILLALLAVGTNTFTDAVARAELGDTESEEALITAGRTS